MKYIHNEHNKTSWETRCPTGFIMPQPEQSEGRSLV